MNLLVQRKESIRVTRCGEGKNGINSNVVIHVPLPQNQQPFVQVLNTNHIILVLVMK